MPGTLPDLIPARILNEHVYCPRLAYLEWVDRQFVDNADTADGTFVHRVVDRERAKPPDPSDAPDAQASDGEPAPSSSAVTVSSERLGLITKVDLLGLNDPVQWKQDDTALFIQPPAKPSGKYAFTFRIVCKNL